MKKLQYLIVSAVFLSGCSGDMAKRTTYETLENIRINNCQAGLSANCSGREGYDEYTRKRNEVVK